MTRLKSRAAKAPANLLRITQRLYLEGCKCKKALYLSKYSPDAAAPRSESQEMLALNGARVFTIAQGLWPDGVVAGEPTMSHIEAAYRTDYLLPREKVIFGAAFEHEDVQVRIDVLAAGVDGYHVYAVQSTLEAEAEHLDDLALQCYVLKGCGVPVSAAAVMHVNKEFVKDGPVDPKLFLVQRDATEEVLERLSDIPRRVSEFRAMLIARDRPFECIGRQCDKPRPCSFHALCWDESVPDGSVLELYNKGVSKYKLWEQGERLIDDLDLAKCRIKAHGQTTQIAVHRARSLHFDAPEVGKFLKSLWYPLHFMDFETTWSNPIPIFEGTSPYQQVPFQYSLHRQDTPSAKVKHTGFIGHPGQDPRIAFLEKLLSEVDLTGCVLAYNAPFERTRLAELARDFPQYADRINILIGNIRDMLTPFAQWHVYHWKMRGSHSIKKVLPALLPALSYKGLRIKNGEEAGLAYDEMMLSTDPVRIKELREALDEYCSLDTYALVALLEKLRQMYLMRSWWCQAAA